MLKLSIVIITLNAENHLKRCLESVKNLGDEIIIVDSGSSDKTMCIATSYETVRFIHQDWLGFGKQKQFAVDCAKNNWVLCLDADECITEELKLSIIDLFKHLDNNAFDNKIYEICRCNYFLGQFLRHGEGYPDWCLRLFNKQIASWSSDLVHEKVIYNQSVQVERLSGDLLHYSAESLKDYLNKQNQYTSIQADILFKNNPNIKLSLIKLILSPILRFIKFYFIKQGFKDGKAGLIHIAIGCFNSFIKYCKLLELIINRKK